ncbi:MAG: aminotransferase class V-fold PLP-dependent enzyme [Holosporales bacterium]|jgi:cysteine desulfurase|nr:aminotransferase class V-fold PLP-dependent enzyme [Holosporales bacterium]
MNDHEPKFFESDTKKQTPVPFMRKNLRSEDIDKAEQQLKSIANNLIYMDYPATTPCDKRVFEKMVPYFCDLYGNSHSWHPLGWESMQAFEAAHKQLADYLGVSQRDVVFTSGATESNVLALRGMIPSNKTKNWHLITTNIEHPSILECCRQLQPDIKVTILPVSNDGIINLDELSRTITDETYLVSVIAVNNETGIIQPLEQIGKICKARGFCFHTDATQALGRISIDLEKCNVSLASFSAHKVYGPKGIGAIYVRSGTLLRPLQVGGGQQRGIRGGTIPVPLCVGFGEACRILAEEGASEVERISELSARLVTGLLAAVPYSQLNSGTSRKVPHIVNMGFPYVEGESIMMGLKDICVSTGSACSSDRLTASHVLQAMHINEYFLQSSIRFGIGRFTTASEIDYVVSRVATEVQRLRDMSPLWEMFNNGIDMNKIKWGRKY